MQAKSEEVNTQYLTEDVLAQASITFSLTFFSNSAMAFFKHAASPYGGEDYITLEWKLKTSRKNVNFINFLYSRPLPKYLVVFLMF